MKTLLVVIGAVVLMLTPMHTFSAQHESSSSASKAEDKPAAVAIPLIFKDAGWVLGRKVVNRAGKTLGKIDDLLVDPKENRVVYSLVTYDAPLTKGVYFAIPWSELQLKADGKSFAFNQYEELHESGNWPRAGADMVAAHGNNVYIFYGREGHKHQQGEAKRAYHATEKSALAEVKDRTMSLDRLTDLPIHAKDGKQAGTLYDLVFDLNTGMIAYGMAKLSDSDRKTAFPWTAAKVSVGDAAVKLESGPEALKKAAWAGDNRPDLSKAKIARDLHQTYGVEPFWHGAE